MFLAPFVIKMIGSRPSPFFIKKEENHELLTTTVRQFDIVHCTIQCDVPQCFHFSAHLSLSGNIPMWSDNRVEIAINRRLLSRDELMLTSTYNTL
jgi:hypothetical protein